MKYDKAYFDKELRNLQNVDFERYANASISDVLIDHLSNEIIYNYLEVQWDLLREDLFEYTVQYSVLPNSFNSPLETHFFSISQMHIEAVIKRFVSLEIRLKFLVNLQQNTIQFFDSDAFPSFEDIQRECSRLISLTIKETENQRKLGFAHHIPTIDYRQYVKSDTLLSEKTPSRIFFEKLSDRERIALEKDRVSLFPPADNTSDISAKNSLKEIIDTLNDQSFEDLDDYLKYIAPWKVANDEIIEFGKLPVVIKQIKNKNLRLIVLKFFKKYGDDYFTDALLYYSENFQEKTKCLGTVANFLKLVDDEIEMLESAGEFSLSPKEDLQTKIDWLQHELDSVDETLAETRDELKEKDAIIKDLEKKNAELIVINSVRATPQEDLPIDATLKVRFQLLLNLLKKAGITKDSHISSDICKLAAILLNCSSQSLANKLSGGFKIAEDHADTVEKINKIIYKMGNPIDKLHI